MKSFALFAAICAVVLSAEATKTANAATLNFDFSFTDPPIGTVTGEIDGLFDNTTGPASAVFIDSFPAAVGPVCSTPCNTTALPWTVLFNDFTVSNGRLTTSMFSSVNIHTDRNIISLDLDTFLGNLTGASGDLGGPVTFSPALSPMPLPATFPLFATGLGGLGLFGWLRKRKSRAGVA